MDPIGLAMEQFDGAGQFRTVENDTVIDASGELDGLPFEDAASLGQALHDNPAAPACLANRLYAYASGRSPAKSEREWMGYLEQRFADTGYKLPSLLREIVLSEAFYRIAPPQDEVATASRQSGAAAMEEDKS